MAHIAPTAMLFVRCAGGISHNPAEAVDEADVAVAIDALERLLRAV
jgi:allantoate deiminase